MKNKKFLANVLASILTMGALGGCMNNTTTSSSSKASNNVASSSKVEGTTSSSNKTSSSSSSKVEKPSSTSSSKENPTSSSSSSSSNNNSNSSSSSNNDPIIDITNRAKEKYTVTPAAKITADQSKVYEASMMDIENIANVEAIKVSLSIDFKGLGSDKQYWGGAIFVNGEEHTFSSGSGSVLNADIDNNSVPESTVQSIFVETNGLSNESIIKVMMYYAGSDFDITLTEITYYYSNGLNKRAEKKEYDITLFSNGNTAGEIEIPLSDFENRSHISKIDLEFYSENSQSYTGGSLFFTGILPIVSSGVLNIGEALVNNGSNTGTVSIYLENYIGFDVTSTIKMASWWSPADLLKLKGVTLYTNVEVVPEAPTNLVGHSGNGEVTLEWDEMLGASCYEVYKDNQLYKTVYRNYCVVDGLTNGQGYEFYVKSKNTIGVSGASMKVTATPNASAEYNQFLDGLNTEIERELGKDNIESAFRKSIVSTGNNYRFKKALEKAKNGDDVTFAYIGGSVTVGEGASQKTTEGFTKGYASYTNDFVNEYYAKDSNIRYLNAAISGTGSEVGIVRGAKDVMDHNPDVVFVEFAANNGYDSFDNETFEGLVRQFLNSPSKPAVVLVLSWVYYSGSKVEEYMINIGNHYDLPTVSIHRGLHEYFDSLYSKFVADDVHPNDNGCKLYAKLLCNMINELDKETIDAEGSMPATTYTGATSHKYDTLTMIDNTSNKVTSRGSFSATNTNYSGTNKSHVTAFQNGWIKEDKTTNNALEVTVDAKNFILVYKASHAQTDGTLVINYQNVNDPSDKGTMTQDLNSYLGGSGNQPGWDNPVSLLVFDKATTSQYKITVTVQSANQSATVLAMAYSY